MTNQQSSQLASLLVANSSDEDFINKIYPSYYSLEEAFSKDSIGLSGGVLLLLGFYPGPWLDRIPEDIQLTVKLHKQWSIYEKAKESIRAKKLKAHFEGTVYYIQLIDLVKWFFDKKFRIHPSILDFFNLKLGLKKRGRPTSCPEIIEKVSQHYKSKGVAHITASILKKEEDPFIQSCVNTYIDSAEISCKNTDQINKRIKRLSKNVTVLLKKTSP